MIKKSGQDVNFFFPVLFPVADWTVVTEKMYFAKYHDDLSNGLFCMCYLVLCDVSVIMVTLT